MTTGAVLFLISAWSLVLGLTGWAYFRILVPRGRRPRRRQGTGPEADRPLPPQDEEPIR